MTTTCDTSVLVSALLAWHPGHTAARKAVVSVRGIPAHVLLETYSVLTRLPAPHRISARDAGSVLDALDVDLLSLPVKAHRRLISTLAQNNVKGGAAYDALVGATARHHGLTLMTRDQRARPTYDLVGADYTLL